MKIKYSHHVYANNVFLKGEACVDGTKFTSVKCVPLISYFSSGGKEIVRELFKTIRQELDSYKEGGEIV